MIEDASTCVQMLLLSRMVAQVQAPARLIHQAGRILRRDGFPRAYAYVAQATGAGPVVPYRTSWKGISP